MLYWVCSNEPLLLVPDILLPSVWISDETPYLVFDILLLNVWISGETFHPVFDTLTLGVWISDETLSRVFDVSILEFPYFSYFCRLNPAFAPSPLILLLPKTATTSCKNVETLSRKNNLSCFKSLLVTGLWDKIVTPPPSPPFKVVPRNFEHGLVLLATLKRGGGGLEHTIMDRPFKPKYGTVSQVLLQLVVVARIKKLTLKKYNN